MNSLRQTVNHLRPLEYVFSNQIKCILPYTNYKLIGEELILTNPRGQCDLWLANIIDQDVNFLLSLELKIGSVNNNTKRKVLRHQTHKYYESMKKYFPEYKVYGLGAYKHPEGIEWYSATRTLDIPEIRLLKNMIDSPLLLVEDSKRITRR